MSRYTIAPNTICHWMRKSIHAIVRLYRDGTTLEEEDHAQFDAGVAI